MEVLVCLVRFEDLLLLLENLVCLPKAIR
jgi:hypothetical protein